MNQNQRKRMQNIIDELYLIAEEEREKYENAPEGLQDTDRVYQFSENADAIEEAIGYLEEIVEA